MTEEQEWASLLAEVFDKLTAKHAAITYKFDKLEMTGTVLKRSFNVRTRHGYGSLLCRTGVEV